ncbi:PqiC family protein [Aliikangiella sp. IMCC44632]
MPPRNSLLGFSLSVFICLLINGCVSEPKLIQFYGLQSAVVHSSAEIKADLAKDRPVIYVAPVKLAEFLRKKGLVLQTAPYQYFISQQHLWAEPLEQNINRAFQALLQASLAESSSVNWLVENATAYGEQHAFYRIELAIDGFQANHANQALVSGTYWIFDREQQLVTKQSFHLANELTQDGYLHTVEKLNFGLAQVVKSIAAEPAFETKQ